MSEVKVQLSPIKVPNYILVESDRICTRQEGINFNSPKYHISELSEETLIELADEFKFNLLKKAKKNEK
jgi:hypothetical protein